MSIQKKHYLIFSFLSHLTLLLLMLFSFKSTTTTIVPLGLEKNSLVVSYLYADTPRTSQPVVSKPIAKASVKKPDIALKKIAKSISVEHKSMPLAHKQQMATTIATGNGLPITELLAKLHTAIQQKQHYPDNALQLEREGRVTVAFMLNVDGSVEQLRVATSSGTASLDAAAITAVNEAAPFRELQQYLRDRQEYRIDVVFQLT